MFELVSRAVNIVSTGPKVVGFALRVSLLMAFAVLSMPEFVSASPGLYSGEVLGGQGIVHKVLDFSDRPTKRGTLDEYAAEQKRSSGEIKGLVAPVGKLICDHGSSSASLVGKRDIIVTAGHSIADKRGCVIRNPSINCVFERPGASPIKVKELIDTGYRCPLLGNYGLDWAILRLSAEATNVTPYALSEKDERWAPRYRKVISIAAFSVDFTRQSPQFNKPLYPLNLQICSVNSVEIEDGVAFAKTNCGVSHGASGGPLLNGEGVVPFFMGVAAGISVGKLEDEKERQDGAPISRAYDSRSWYTVMTLASGTFYASLSAAINSKIEAAPEIEAPLSSTPEDINPSNRIEARPASK